MPFPHRPFPLRTFPLGSGAPALSLPPQRRPGLALLHGLQPEILPDWLPDLLAGEGREVMMAGAGTPGDLADLARDCQARGGLELTAHARRRLNCDFHENSDDGQYTLEPVYCLGLCAQSPAVMLDGVPHARVTPEKLDALLSSQEAQS